MTVTVGTFNLNNLFSRFNFQGAIQALASSSGAAGSLTFRYEFTDANTFRVRTFRGKLVQQKDPEETQTIADRILAMDVDVLAVQEVENIGILKEFNRNYLQGLYDYQVLIEGNDPRFIDVGILSRLPIGAVTSHQTATHPVEPDKRIFGRDLLEVEIWNSGRSKRLFTVFNNHLKSRFVPPEVDPVVGQQQAEQRRQRQAEMIQRIVSARTRPNSAYIILGDMNDPPDAAALAAIRSVEGNQLINALANPRETRPAKPESTGPGPASPAWTHRFKPSGQNPEHLLFDQIWLSPSLATRQTDAVIDRRMKHGGDGSDHDPAWIELDL